MATRDITQIEDDERADNEGVDRLATAMKAKLAAKRLEGRGGWHNDCGIERLREMLREHVGKGDILDVANFSMMIWNRENPNAPARHTEQVPLGYVLVELDRINHLIARLKALVDAGSADARSIASDAALLLGATVRHG